jgi:rhamnosyltransferase
MPDDPASGTPERARVCAVWVTFHPDEEFSGRVTRILPQVGATLIVDNGSDPGEMRQLRAIAAWPSVTLLCNGDNLGIAQALNIGVDRARAAGYSWALLLDQDTRADVDMVDRLAAALMSCGYRERVAAVGSRFRDPTGRSNEPIRMGPRGELWEEVESVITSGCLLSLHAHCTVGPFRNDFFIDHVDTEYCLRARAAGFRVIETLQPLMSHTVGAPTSHTLFGRPIWTTNHSADRRYYIARNNTVLLREYGTSGRGPWQLKSIARCLRLCRRIACFERDKLRKILAVAQGWWDAMRGRMGPRRRSTEVRTRDAGA